MTAVNADDLNKALNLLHGENSIISANSGYSGTKKKEVLTLFKLTS